VGGDKPFYIGSSSVGYPWQGKVDEIRKWNCALSEDEQLELFRKPPQSPATKSAPAKAHDGTRDAPKADETAKPVAPDPIGKLVANLSATNGRWLFHGDWISRKSPALRMSVTASTEEVLQEVFKFTDFEKGHVKKFKLVESRSVQIDGHPHTAALVQTDLGTKIVLFTAGSAFNRVYDADEPAKAGPPLSKEAQAVLDGLNLKAADPAWQAAIVSIEQPETRPPNQVISGEVSAFLADSKKRLTNMGVRVAWNATAKRYEAVAEYKKESSAQKDGGENWAVLKGDWAVERRDIPEILLGSKAYLERKLAGTPSDMERSNIKEILSKWDAYSCQLLPVTTKIHEEKTSEEKTVVMRFFPTRETAGMFKNWRSEPVNARGGGSDYWRLSYDPEKREYFGLGVNAPK
jgi:hypothetical protein